MRPIERVRAREKVRCLANSAKRAMGEEPPGRLNDVVCELAEALELLANISESQEPPF